MFKKLVSMWKRHRKFVRWVVTCNWFWSCQSFILLAVNRGLEYLALYIVGSLNATRDQVETSSRLVRDQFETSSRPVRGHCRVNSASARFRPNQVGRARKKFFFEFAIFLRPPQKSFFLPSGGLEQASSWFRTLFELVSNWSRTGLELVSNWSRTGLELGGWRKV